MKFQSDYCDEYENPIVFYVGRRSKDLYRGRSKSEIYIWALNEFFEERFFLVGIEDDSGMVVDRAKRLVDVLNRKAKKFLVPQNFDDWAEDTEGGGLSIMSSSKKDNSKFK
jgi:hypothetical protein